MVRLLNNKMNVSRNTVYNWFVKGSEYLNKVLPIHRIEEHDMLNWLKANRKVMNAGKMKAERMEPFKQLLALVKANKHLNQYI